MNFATTARFLTYKNGQKAQTLIAFTLFFLNLHYLIFEKVLFFS